MKLAAIYNVFDGTELLAGSMRCLKDHVDVFVMVVQKVSNYGEEYDGFSSLDLSEFQNIEVVNFTPEIIAGTRNETMKRNIGIMKARELDCDHFILMDCDEYYSDFGSGLEEFLRSGYQGSVARLFTYFKKPTFRTFHTDNYYVPFVHKLRADTFAGARNYPFYVDPTRRVNHTMIMEVQEVMHHFSWVRDDIERKVRNSSAQVNIKKSTLLQDYYRLQESEYPEGFFIQGLGQNLTIVENQFNIEVVKNHP